MSQEYICGIDEAGRGPLAGPVAVGAVLAPLGFDFSVFERLADSKKLSAKRRDELFEKLVAHPELRFNVAFRDAQEIDTHGIVPSVMHALCATLTLLAPDPRTTRIFLDGGLRAPDTFLSQETIIHGDALVPVISLASIAAKVLRDRLMEDIDTMYPEYGFKQHKGYGTLLHLAHIKKYGMSPVHRRTFIHLHE